MNLKWDMRNMDLSEIHLHLKVKLRGGRKIKVNGEVELV